MPPAVIRWIGASLASSIPPAAAPISFGFAALATTGRSSDGALMILAMTLAQIAAAVPLTRIAARHMSAATSFRMLTACRAMAFAGMAIGLSLKLALWWILAAAVLAGSVNGAAHGLLRDMLNPICSYERRPKVLSITATLNEAVFAVIPVVASALGTFAPIWSILFLALAGLVPIPLVPPIVVQPTSNGRTKTSAAVFDRFLMPWFACAVAGGAVVASVEVGAVSLALGFGYQPAMAIAFTLPLCIASIAGGVWMSLGHHEMTKAAILRQLWVMALGGVLVAVGSGLFIAIAGIVLIGSVLAPLATQLSVAVDELAHVDRRAEAFALLRTATAVGVIVASALLALLPLTWAISAAACFLIGTTTFVTLTPARF